MKNAHIRPRIRDLERLLNWYKNQIENENRRFGYRREFVAEEEKPFNPNQQVLKLSSEFQELKNQVNKYMKIEAREESIAQFRELVSEINEIKEVYVQHKADAIVFFVLYDRGDKLAVLERVVDIEVELENVFKTLNFDFRVLAYSEASTKMFCSSESIYNREENKTHHA